MTKLGVAFVVGAFLCMTVPPSQGQEQTSTHGPNIRDCMNMYHPSIPEAQSDDVTCSFLQDYTFCILSALDWDYSVPLTDQNVSYVKDFNGLLPIDTSFCQVDVRKIARWVHESTGWHQTTQAPEQTTTAVDPKTCDEYLPAPSHPDACHNLTLHVTCHMRIARTVEVFDQDMLNNLNSDLNRQFRSQGYNCNIDIHQIAEQLRREMNGKSTTSTTPAGQPTDSGSTGEAPATTPTTTIYPPAPSTDLPCDDYHPTLEQISHPDACHNLTLHVTCNMRRAGTVIFFTQDEIDFLGSSLNRQFSSQGFNCTIDINQIAQQLREELGMTRSATLPTSTTSGTTFPSTTTTTITPPTTTTTTPSTTATTPSTTTTTTTPSSSTTTPSSSTTTPSTTTTTTTPSTTTTTTPPTTTTTPPTTTPTTPSTTTTTTPPTTSTVDPIQEKVHQCTVAFVTAGTITCSHLSEYISCQMRVQLVHSPTPPSGTLLEDLLTAWEVFHQSYVQQNPDLAHCPNPVRQIYADLMNELNSGSTSSTTSSPTTPSTTTTSSTTTTTTKPSTTTSTTNTTTTPKSAHCVRRLHKDCASQPDGQYPACGPRCKRGDFYTCVHGQAYRQQCPSGWYRNAKTGRYYLAATVFDPELKRCEYKSDFCPRKADRDVAQ